MCWMALIPVAIGMVSSMSQKNQQNAAALTQAAELKRNAAYLSGAANDAKARGAIDADVSRMQTQNFIGSQRAALAGGGGQVDTGTNALLQQDAAQFGELDALIISNNAAREAYGYEVQSDSYLRNARTLKNSTKGGMFSSLLGGAVQGLGSAYGSGSFGGGASAGGGVNLQGQSSALTSNSAFVSNM